MDAKLLHHLLAESIEGIIVTNAEGTILLANATAERMLGFGANEMVGEFVGVAFPMTSTVHLLPNLLKIARDEGGFDGEITLMTLDDEAVPVRLLADCYQGDGPLLLVFRFLDWREVNEMMRQVRDVGETAVLSDLSRSMAHEILNPVSVIGAHVRKLVGTLSEGSEQEEWVRQVISNVEVLESLVGTVSNYIHLPTPSFRKGSLQSLVDGCVKKSMEILTASGIEVVHRGTAPLPEIYLDPVLLEKAITAVLMNAAERMPRGGRLTLSRTVMEDRGDISLTDTGPRLSRRQMQEDLSPVRVVRANHSDLNLAIARKIVEAHGGLMTLSSREPMGLTVEMSLPVDRRRLARRREQ